MHSRPVEPLAPGDETSTVGGVGYGRSVFTARRVTDPRRQLRMSCDERWRRALPSGTRGRNPHGLRRRTRWGGVALGLAKSDCASKRRCFSGRTPRMLLRGFASKGVADPKVERLILKSPGPGAMALARRCVRSSNRAAPCGGNRPASDVVTACQASSRLAAQAPGSSSSMALVG